MIVGRLLYFVSHPSEYLGLWTLDLTVVTLVFTAATLAIVLLQLKLMRQQTGLMTHQDTLMQRQTDIVVRQDETNRGVLARRSKLVMFMRVESASQVVVCCRNDGNKTARDFYWHLAVPSNVPANTVWNAYGKSMLLSIEGGTHDGEKCRYYSQHVDLPLYPTRETPIARIGSHFENLPLWWSTVSEDGSDPTPDGKMGKME